VARLVVVRGRRGGRRQPVSARETKTEGELVVALVISVGGGGCLSGAGRGRRPLVPLAAGCATAICPGAEAQGDEVVGAVVVGAGIRRRRRRDGELLLGHLGCRRCLLLHLDDVEEVHLQGLVLADDAGQHRLEALVLLPHLAHLRPGRLQPAFLLLDVDAAGRVSLRRWKAFEDYRKSASYHRWPGGDLWLGVGSLLLRLHLRRRRRPFDGDLHGNLTNQPS